MHFSRTRRQFWGVLARRWQCAALRFSAASATRKIVVGVPHTVFGLRAELILAVSLGTYVDEVDAAATLNVLGKLLGKLQERGAPAGKFKA